jgi:hypothetical protein
MRLFSYLAATMAAGVLVLAGFGAGRAEAGPPFNNVNFKMVPTLGAESCVASAFANVTVAPVNTQLALVENLHVEAYKLPAITDFDLFIIQQPGPPFGLAWYLGDLLTDGKGTAVGDFVGRFSIGTFIVALPPSVAAPVVLKGDASSNPATAPVQLYHLGLWFDSPADANKKGCGNKVTPFNSTHNAGVQVLNTSNFPNLFGPLRKVVDR